MRRRSVLRRRGALRRRLTTRRRLRAGVRVNAPNLKKQKDEFAGEDVDLADERRDKPAKLKRRRHASVMPPRVLACLQQFCILPRK